MSKRFAVLCIYSVALFVLAVIPPIGVTINGAGMMLKLHHIAGFFVHTILVSIYLIDRGDRIRYWPLLAAVISFAFGMLIEFAQLFLSYRTGRVEDLAQNALGIAIGQALIYFARSKGWLYRTKERLGGSDD